MDATIIAGYDSSSEADDAIALAGWLAQATGAEVVVATAWHHDTFPSRFAVPSFDNYLREDAEARAREGVEKLPAGVEGRAIAVPGSSAAAGLHDLAEREETDLLVVGSTAHGPLGRILLGSTGARLIQASPCAVAVAPRGFATRHNAAPSVIAVAYDGSPEARTALDHGRALAEAFGASLRVLTVVEPPDPQTAILASSWAVAGGYTNADVHAETRERRRAALDEALEGLPQAVRPSGALLEGDPATALAAETQHGVDLLVTGSRGYGPVRRVLLGAVTTGLVRSAACPVLVIPRGAAVKAAGPVPVHA